LKVMAEIVLGWADNQILWGHVINSSQQIWWFLDSQEAMPVGGVEGLVANSVCPVVRSVKACVAAQPPFQT
jgi:hypothetical protein